VAADNRRLAERVEVFNRATSDALQKAVGEVLDAKGPWQLLYRLSRIVLLGLVLYTAWLLITLQPDLAKRISTTTTAATLQEQVSARQAQVQTLLRTAIESGGDGLHTLALLQWEGGGSVTVLAADGRHGQLALTPGQQPLLGVTMAGALGHASLGLCASDEPAALPMRVHSSADRDGEMLLCPVGCSRGERREGLLLALYDTDAAANGSDQRLRRQTQLQLIARRLGDVLSEP
jgi:hypothetical protein